MFWKLLVFLSCLQVVAGASTGCSALRKCEKAIRSENLFADKESMVFKIDDEKMLDRVCGKVPALKDCVCTHLPACKSDDTVSNLRFFKDTMEYICTPAGRTVALATGKSSCTMDPTLDKWFLDKMGSCSIKFIADTVLAKGIKGSTLTDAELCPLKKKLDTCLVNGMKDKCGPEMGNLIEKMWVIWSKYEFEYDCTKSPAVGRRDLEDVESITEGTRWIRGIRN